MDSTQFCGLTCHKVMAPEYAAYLDSPHSRVACVQCHIGPSAAQEIKAKWNGIHQLVSVLTSKYDRPVMARAEQLLPAQETCLECHTPRRFMPDRIRLFAHYALDKDNTPKFNAVALRDFVSTAMPLSMIAGRASIHRPSMRTNVC